MKYLINYNKKTIGQIFLSEDKEKDIRTIYNLATSVILGDNPSYDKVVIQARVKVLEEDDFFGKANLNIYLSNNFVTHKLECFLLKNDQELRLI